jgi:hypothetical protein
MAGKIHNYINIVDFETLNEPFFSHLLSEIEHVFLLLYFSIIIYFVGFLHSTLLSVIIVLL